MSNTQFLPAFLKQLEGRLEAVPHHWDREQNRELDPHQGDAMSAITDSIRQGIGKLDMIHISVQQSGGSGKTTLITNLAGAALDVRTLHADKEGKIIIVTTERALVNGVRKELCDLGIDEDMLGQWGAGKKEIDRPILLASIQALQMNKNLETTLPRNNNLIVIGDEADVFLTKSRMAAINTLGGFARIGLTATKEWPDKRHIKDFWGPVVAEFSLAEGIRTGVNVPPIFHLYEAKIDESSLTVVNGDYDPRETGKAYAAIEIEKSITELYGKLVPEKDRKNFPALIYVPNTALVGTVATELRTQYPDLRIRTWTGEQTTNSNLEEDVTSYNAGNTDVLILCQMGGRGLNLPRARVLIDADPTLSPTKLEQRDSRVLRRLRGNEEGKPFSVIVQIVPQSTKTRSLCLPDILEGGWESVERGEPLLTPSSVQGRMIIERAAQYSERLKHEDPIVHLTHMETVDIFAELNIREARGQKTFEQWVGILRQWNIDHPNQVPSIRSKNAEEKGLAHWLNSIRSRLRDDLKFAQGEGKVLLEMGVKPAEKKEDITKRFNQWVEILRQWNIDHPNQVPSKKSKNEEEKRLACWLNNMRRKLRDDPEFAKGEGKVLLEMGVKPAKKID